MKKVNQYLDKIKNWKEETILLREICLECGLEEDFKWMHPCYTFQGKNILLIHGFKEYCALLFYKGVLLDNTNNLLSQQTKKKYIVFKYLSLPNIIIFYFDHIIFKVDDYLFMTL